MKAQVLRKNLVMSCLLLVAMVAGASNCLSQEIDPTVFYRIIAKHSGKCLAVAGGPSSLRNGDRVLQWQCIEEDNQKWQLVPVAEGYYKILAKHSGKALDVYGGVVSLGNGVMVHQWDYFGTGNQLWKLVRDAEGYYNIIAKHSGKSLDINGGPGATDNGPQAQQWEYVGGDNQKFRLTAVGGTGTAGGEVASGSFTYTDTEANPDGGESRTFLRPIARALVQVWSAGVLVSTTETNDNGFFSVTIPRMPRGTDTTVLLYATNAAAQVLAGTGPYFVRLSRLSQDTNNLSFGQNFETSEQIRSFNAAEVIRIAHDYARANRDPNEREVIPKVDVSFNDLGGLMTHYNQPTSGLVFDPQYNTRDLVIMHEYAHFLEDKIGSFLVLPSYHDGCFATQRCQNPSDCANLPGLPAQTQLINSPENAWMEGFADYFAMAVKRANPSKRFNLTRGGTTTEATLNQPGSCLAVGRAAFDGRVINGEMVEHSVAAVLWAASDGGSSDAAVFRIFDRELDLSTTRGLPSIKLFHDAWVARGLDHPRLDRILREREIPTVAAH